MGSPYIYEKLFSLLGHEVVTPPRPSQKTINYGVKYSPEFACFPLKVILGTYLEAIELGADTIYSNFWREWSLQSGLLWRSSKENTQKYGL
ncbi:MAG: hypothetical protein PWP18_738 [Thermoanaerobacter sp.]|jgi:predicted nucleotide-binding protein (sugar kinase/HSP70/actin superfamily)|nr:hypothetical protein [Thermoanaerobacter sp.]